MNGKIIRIIGLSALVILTLGCKKQPKPEPERPDEQQKENTAVPALQYKHYLSAEDDLAGKVTPLTAGLKLVLQDSKFYAVGERILNVSFTADKDIVGEIKDDVATGSGKTVKMQWASEDPVNRPAVGHAPDAAGFGLLCLPGTYEGVFSVETVRHTYAFTKSITLTAGQTVAVTLDFAQPDVQPVRKVGVIGDSISTFDGTMCSDEYTAFYPTSDPNVGTNPSIAVDSKEKTYWWRLIYDKMQHGELDVNNSWSGTRVVHEIKNGRKTGQSMGAGFVDRALNFVDPDIILIHGGTNDKNQSSPLGTYDWDYPIGQLDLNCYRSAYIQLIKTLQNSYEGVQIIIIIGDTLTTDYENSTIEIANHFGMPYVDFVGVSIAKCKGSHPTSQGFETMANTIYNTCKDYLP
ncbi:MAG: hypothetical protein IK045_07670 [Bacteroidales bacterium]|nr:hypothetical protein [Bacteroidales bacterium]